MADENSTRKRSVFLPCTNCGNPIFVIPCRQSAKTRFCCVGCQSNYAIRPDRVAERVWGKVDKNGPIPPHVPEIGNCWEWEGTINKTGYGVLSFGKKQVFAHRKIFEISGNDIPSGKFLCHRCDNPKCVRPFHMFVGTQLENMRDRNAKGRGCEGSKSGKAKINDAIARSIREDRKSGMTFSAIATKYGISKANARFVASRVTWRHVI